MGKKIIIGFLTVLKAAVLIIAVAAAIIVVPYLIKLSFMERDTGVSKVDTTLTVEQKLRDLEYMYDIACLQNPRKEMFEEVYGISYEDIYNRYREYVKNTESEYEYLGYLTSFLAVLPGEHNLMRLPDYDRNAVNGGFILTEQFATQEMKDYTYSWKEDFRDDVEVCRDHNMMLFRYVDGKYVGVKLSSSAFTCTDAYVNGQIVSIDGKDPKDMCFELFERYVPVYDQGNDCFFRRMLIFNDGIGVKHTAEILMPDGTTVTCDLYDDPGYDLACMDASIYYPDLFGEPESDSSGSDEASDVPSSYRIEKDPDRKLVYINYLSCEASEGDRLVEDLQKALDEAGAETVILDLRSNGGGISTTVTDKLLPVLFSQDVEFKAVSEGRLNSTTELFYDRVIYRLYDMFISGGNKNEIKGDTFYYTEDLSVEGRATRDYRIYVLTSQQTFSSADIASALCKEYDNATLVGTNTEGEGISGSPCNCYLPESRFMFVYVPTVNVTYPYDSCKGIEPDIYVHFTVEEYLQRYELIRQGSDVESYGSRMTWDKTLQTVIELIDGAG
ncbi:Peptidase family S41 [Ruminococcaceae bacterium YRB3002]|nr:Peptidase family S41 [Ruminococcaceae bacterium YRB3002]